jgi:hypothetical protein
VDIIDICTEVDTSGLMLYPNIIRQFVWLALKSHLTIHIYRFFSGIDALSPEYQMNSRQIAEQMFMNRLGRLDPTEAGLFNAYHDAYVQTFIHMIDIQTLIPFIDRC